MSGLMGLLDMGVAAFHTHSVGVGVVGHNIANASTPGYSRQSVLLNADEIMGGVRADGVLRSENHLLAGRERDAAGSLGYSQSTSAALVDLDGQLALGNDNLVDGIAAFFGSFVDLSAAPLDEGLRQAAVEGANDLAESFSVASARVTNAIDRSDGRLSGLAQRATELASQIAAANRSIAGKFDPTIADQRDLAAVQLAEIIGGQARIDADGYMRFVTAGGVVVVDGDRPATIEAVPDPALDGRLRIDVVDGIHREDVTGRMGGGAMAGELAFRDGDASAALARIDQLAFDFATAINAEHQGYAAPDGTTGLNLFDAPAVVEGAAAAMAVDATVAADPGVLATATIGAGPGDTTGLLAMLDLREQPLAAAGERTFVDEAIGTLSSVGFAAQQASGARELELARTDAIAAMRDSLSGVSLEEEMNRLAQLQRSAEAATTFVSTVDDMLAQLIATL